MPYAWEKSSSTYLSLQYNECWSIARTFLLQAASYC